MYLLRIYHAALSIIDAHLMRTIGQANNGLTYMVVYERQVMSPPTHIYAYRRTCWSETPFCASGHLCGSASIRGQVMTWMARPSYGGCIRRDSLLALLFREPDLCGMPATVLIIRNMVCERCKTAVGKVMDSVGLPVRRIDLGEVELMEKPSKQKMAALENALVPLGFELAQGRDAETIARIRSAVLQLVQHQEGDKGRTILSTWLSDTLHKEYTGMAALFSSVEGITIEHYFLLQRIERVKELAFYGDLTISEIAYRTGFSSAAHLSGQFKMLTGMPPSAFRKLGGPRIPLDRVG